ncbi:aminotransferase class V-fold PLP-dependent enzyme [Gangjinia marincola]|uniref:Aminotransferase class V-fold PLP-dependent enzyme n=1 Tax=Gangjinia marincola TaxID=578463 RepID=A0ABN1MIK7_9FLAO
MSITSSQKHLFDLPEEITYLNGAYMSPQLSAVSEIGIASIKRKVQPHLIKDTDFFTQRKQLKNIFAKLINAPDPENCAIIPSVSYGIANAANNCPIQAGDEILLIDEQFPSNVYIWQELAKKNDAKIRIIAPPSEFTDRGQKWNLSILNAINPETAVIAMGHIHWADGTLFDLKLIRAKASQVHAKLIIDGTQSVGALPFDVAELQPDALICGGYKWLMGPYSLGMAYYADTFNEGTPIEHNWMSRYNSEDFAGLTLYEERYQPKAAKYSVGESSNFILVPMLITAIDQLLHWKPAHIQQYCQSISAEAIQELRELGCYIEDDQHTAYHLFGVYLPETIPMEQLKKELLAEGVYVSYRGKAIRVSPHVYNDAHDLEKLIRVFKKIDL